MRAGDPESAPEPRAIDAIQPAVNHQPVGQPGRASIVDLGMDDDRIRLLLRHFYQRESELLRKQSARDLDKAQVRDVGYDTATISVKKHHLHVCANMRG